MSGPYLHPMLVARSVSRRALRGSSQAQAGEVVAEALRAGDGAVSAWNRLAPLIAAVNP